MKKLVLIVILLAFHATSFAQNANSVSGRVADKETGKALPGATVTVKGHSIAVTTDNDGFYSLSNLKENKVLLIVSYIGYETGELIVIFSDKPVANVDITLTAVFRTGDDIVISASKRPEKIVNAPASIQVIGKKELDKIFDRFYRISPSRNAKTEGAGLGLAIVKSIVDLHRGKIAVQSVIGQGTSVRLLFPA